MKMGRAEGRNNNRRTRGTAAAAALSRARTRDFQSSPSLPLPSFPSPPPLAAHQRSCQPNGLQSGSGLWAALPQMDEVRFGLFPGSQPRNPDLLPRGATCNCNAVTATTATEGRCLPRPEHESGETWLALVMMMAVFSEQQQGEEVKRGRIAGRE